MTGIEALMRIKMRLKARRKEWEQNQYAIAHTITRTDGRVSTEIIVYIDVPEPAILFHKPIRYIEAGEFLKDDWEVVE